MFDMDYTAIPILKIALEVSWGIVTKAIYGKYKLQICSRILFSSHSIFMRKGITEKLDL